MKTLFGWAMVLIENNKKTTKLSLNVTHRPNERKALSLERLNYEATGEIVYAVLSGRIMEDFVELSVSPKMEAVEPVRDGYIDYIEYLISKLGQENEQDLIDSPYIKDIPVRECIDILQAHLKLTRFISQGDICAILRNWSLQQAEWIKNNAILERELTEVACQR